jgi:hypothetical protein
MCALAVVVLVQIVALAATPATPSLALPGFQLYLPVPWGATLIAGAPHTWEGTGDGVRSSLDLGIGAGEMSVHAAAGGTVHVANSCWLWIDHADGWQTRYYHLKNIDASLNNQPVAAGRRLADAGQPGTAETCGSGSPNYRHVHFALYLNGAPVSVDGLSIGGYTVHQTGAAYCGYWTRNSDGAIVADSRSTCWSMPSVANNQLNPASSGGGSTAPLRLTSGVTVTAPEGWFTFRPIRMTFTGVNQSSSNVDVKVLSIPIRDPYGSPYDLPCATDVSIPPGGGFSCDVSNPWGSVGTYTYWADWMTPGGVWHLGDLGPQSTFTLSAAPPAPTGNGGSTIVGRQSGRCLDVGGVGTTNGTSLQLWDCHGGANQQWTHGVDNTIRVYGSSPKCLDAAGGFNGAKIQIWDCHGAPNQQWIAYGDGTLRSVSSGRCLDAAGFGTANGTRLQLWDCAGTVNQQWGGTARPNGGGKIRGVGSGRCLDVSGVATSPGTPLQLWDCTNGPNQQWLTAGKAIQVYDNKCLDVRGFGTANGAVVQIWYCTGTANQRWNFLPDGTIRSVLSGRCLDAAGLGTVNGTRLQLWDCYGSANQRWTR